jgi:hypothetical protein
MPGRMPNCASGGCARHGALGPAIWPDCPPHLAREYQRIRAIIGSRAARDQLLSIEGAPALPFRFQHPGA